MQISVWLTTSESVFSDSYESDWFSLYRYPSKVDVALEFDPVSAHCVAFEWGDLRTATSNIINCSPKKIFLMDWNRSHTRKLCSSKFNIGNVWEFTFRKYMIVLSNWKLKISKKCNQQQILNLNGNYTNFKYIFVN